MFGSWIESIATYKEQYSVNKPFPHVIIDNFLNDDVIKKLEKEFPPLDDTWMKYWNPIEKKFAKNNWDQNETYGTFFSFLQSDACLNVIKTITGIDNLEKDEHLHGAGIHYHPNGGKLDMHLDYGIHPITKKERRINLLIYLNRDWKEEYGGHLELWSEEFVEASVKVLPIYNRAVIMQTSDISYHGMPKPITCPEDKARKSIAIYYVSDARENVEQRLKAKFRKLPWQPDNEKLDKLYELRSKSILTKDILDSVYPNWEQDGHGFW